MIALRRAKDRQHVCRRKHDTWSTFFPIDTADPLTDGFGALEIFEESRLPPGAPIAPRAHREADFITYVREGTLALEDSAGGSGVIYAGEFQRTTHDRRVRHSERNASQTGWAHIFQMSLHPAALELDRTHEQKRFSTAQRRGALCVVVSPDGRRNSLRIRQNVLVHSAILDPGRHVVYEIPQGRIVWLHVVSGEAALGDVVLAAGDGVGITAELAVSLTAREETEILLVDLPGQLPKPQG